MDIATQARALVQYVRSLPDFQLLDLMDGQYDHMGAIIGDAMLQAGVKYETVIAARLKRLRERYPQAKLTQNCRNMTAYLGIVGRRTGQR
jgi:hypothetical protein